MEIAYNLWFINTWRQKSLTFRLHKCVVIFNCSSFHSPVNFAHASCLAQWRVVLGPIVCSLLKSLIVHPNTCHKKSDLSFRYLDFNSLKLCAHVLAAKSNFVRGNKCKDSTYRKNISSVKTLKKGHTHIKCIWLFRIEPNYISQSPEYKGPIKI